MIHEDHGILIKFKENLFSVLLTFFWVDKQGRGSFRVILFKNIYNG